MDTGGDGELPVHAGDQNQQGAHGHSVGAGARGFCEGVAYTRVPLQQHHQTGADHDAVFIIQVLEAGVRDGKVSLY